MRASKIADHERSFFNSGVDNSGHKFHFNKKTIPYGSEGKTVTLIDCIRDNKDDTFYKNFAHKKDQIVLHFTAGYLKGDIAALTQPNRNVSVAFVIARGGEILRLWPSELWSYHLGRGASGGNEINSKRSVGIELSNIGYLKKIGSNLVTYTSDSDVYCTLDETRQYDKISSPFRGHSYYASFTNGQYDSLISLLDYLEDKHMIPLNFLEENKRYETLSGAELERFSGVVSHINYRGLNSKGKFDKWDLGPAFNWNWVIEAL